MKSKDKKMTRLYNLYGTVCVEPVGYWKEYCEEIGEEWEFFEDLLQPVDKKLELGFTRCWGT